MLTLFPRGLTARISGFHPGGPGSTPGVGTLFPRGLMARISGFHPGGSFFFLGFFFKGGESTDLVSCSWTLFLSRLDPTRVHVMKSPLLSWLWDATLNESSVNTRRITLCLVILGILTDDSKSSTFYHYLKVAILLAENVTSFTRASDCRIPPLFITGVGLSAADFSYIFHPTCRISFKYTSQN